MELLGSTICDACATKLCDIRAIVREACAGLAYGESDLNGIVLAVDEATANVIRHAYGESDDGNENNGEEGNKINLSIHKDSNFVIIQIRDFAPPIDPSSIELTEEQRLKDVTNFEKDRAISANAPMPGGLGLPLIHSIMDSVKLLPLAEQTGNLLELRKKLPQATESNET